MFSVVIHRKSFVEIVFVVVDRMYRENNSVVSDDTEMDKYFVSSPETKLYTNPSTRYGANRLMNASAYDDDTVHDDHSSEEWADKYQCHRDDVVDDEYFDSDGGV